MTLLERFTESFGIAWVWRKFETLMVWLGRFAWDKEKGEPSHRRGIALMCATALCAGFLWVAGWTPFKDVLRDILIQYAWVIVTAGGLGVAGTVIAGMTNKPKSNKTGEP